MMMCVGLSGCGNPPNDHTPQPEPAPAAAAAPATASTPAPADAAERDTGTLVQQLRERYADRLAGIYREPERQRIVVRLTGTTPVEPERRTLSNGTVSIVFELGAAHSLAQLSQVLVDHTATIDTALPGAHARYVDERTGTIVIAVAPDTRVDPAKTAALERALGVPVRIQVEAPVVPQR